MHAKTLKLFNIGLAMLWAARPTAADFVFGKYSNSYIDGDVHHPSTDFVDGTFLTTYLGDADFTSDDFPDSGTNAGTGAWGKVETNNICNMPIPGCPDNLRIVGYGNPDYDCGAHIATVDNGLQNPDGIDTPYGKVIDIVEGPTGEYMSCTYGGRHEGNVGFTGGTSNYHAEVVCQGLACGGLYKNRKDSGI